MDRAPGEEDGLKKDRHRSRREWIFHVQFTELLEELRQLCLDIGQAPNGVKAAFRGDGRFLTGFLGLVDNPFRLYDSEGSVSAYIFDPLVYVNYFNTIIAKLHYITWSPFGSTGDEYRGELPSRYDQIPEWDLKNLHYFCIVVYKVAITVPDLVDPEAVRYVPLPQDVRSVIMNFREAQRFVDVYNLLYIFHQQLRSMMDRAMHLALANRVAAQEREQRLREEREQREGEQSRRGSRS